MPRQTLATTTPAGPRPLAAATAVTWTAAHTTDKEQVVITEGEIVLIWNSSADTAYDYTITAVADDMGRDVDIGPTELAFGAMVAFKPGLEGFAQPTTNYLFMEAENAAIKYAVLRFR